MNTTAVRIHGKKDLRLDTFALPPTGSDEILASVISNSICMSSHKAAEQGEDHKRVPDDVSKNPTIIGHEFSGELLEVGERWQGEFQAGQKYSIQPALGVDGSLDAPGYSFQTVGGNATHVLLPKEVMEQKCLLPYNGKGFFPASLSEPMSCIVGAFHATYHTDLGSYIHKMGIAEGGKMALLAGCGPMGLGAIDFAIHCDRKPGLLVVTDVDENRLARAQAIHSTEEAAQNGVRLLYLNTGKVEDPVRFLMDTSGGSGYDDVFVFAPIEPVIEQGDQILGRDGCLNFFAGPPRTDFTARINLYNVHYGATHLMGTSGGNTDDMRESLKMMAEGKIDPATMVTHVGGMNSVIPTIMDLPAIPGGKKLIYTHVEMDLTAIDSFGELGKADPLFAELAEIVEGNNGLWSVEAERVLLEKGKKLKA